MHQIAYVSKATNKITIGEIPVLMETSRRNNLANNITGILLVEWPYFLQVVEGSKDDVINLLNKLYDDDRHQELKVIYERSFSDEREFARWQMGCKIIGKEFRSEFSHVHNRFKDVLNNFKLEKGEIAHQLFLDFRELENERFDI